MDNLVKQEIIRLRKVLFREITRLEKPLKMLGEVSFNLPDGLPGRELVRDGLDEAHHTLAAQIGPARDVLWCACMELGDLLSDEPLE